MADHIERSAIISDDLVHRYELRRVWDPALTLLVVCMLNPSTADAEVDDPTIKRLIKFGASWGYGGILVVNLYSFRAAKPADLWAAEGRIGVDNEKHVHAAMNYAAENGGRLLAAWGADDRARYFWFTERALNLDIELIALGTASDGSPKHPMARGRHRVPDSQQPVVWRKRRGS